MSSSARRPFFETEWYHGYSPNGQFLDQRLQTSPLAYVVPSITIHF